LHWPSFHRREPDPFTPVKLIIIIESPIGLINLKEICQFGTSSAKHLGLVAVIFGSDNFLARLGNIILVHEDYHWQCFSIANSLRKFGF
jgi:hypothetical protein